MKQILQLQGHDINGWDTRDIHDAEELRGYLHGDIHYGEITAYILDEARNIIRQYSVPAGIGRRFPLAERTRRGY